NFHRVNLGRSVVERRIVARQQVEAVRFKNLLTKLSEKLDQRLSCENNVRCGADSLMVVDDFWSSSRGS
ncbi:MAG TPA: hypothetical protein VEL78_05420, partial [Pyrinomonadaceae bacterium]|nr:hypothetical protein [Pyrinomonadaceae bacterium]